MRIIIKPLITEKHSGLSEQLNQYGFVVDTKAGKNHIKAEVEKLYGVSVEKVRTMQYKPKQKNRYTKRNVLKGRTNYFKKAIVTLKKDDTIDFYSNI
jgi:large subunit ribosomal protein L23